MLHPKPLSVIHQKSENNFFAFVNAFPVPSVTMFFISDKNIPRYFMYREKNDEIYKNPTNVKLNAFCKWYIRSII